MCSKEGSPLNFSSFITYAEALLISGLDRLSTRRQTLSRKAFNQIKSATHVLNHLLVPRVVNGDQMKMRTKYPYVIPRLKTDRAARSVIWHGLKNRWLQSTVCAILYF